MYVHLRCNNDASMLASMLTASQLHTAHTHALCNQRHIFSYSGYLLFILFTLMHLTVTIVIIVERIRTKFCPKAMIGTLWSEVWIYFIFIIVTHHSLHHSFIHSFIPSFLHSFLHSFIHSFIQYIVIQSSWLCFIIISYSCCSLSFVWWVFILLTLQMIPSLYDYYEASAYARCVRD